MFSSTNNIPAQPPRTGGIVNERIATNEAARPLPYFAGTRRIGVTFISDPFDIRAEPVTTSAGKGGSQVSGYRYFASFAALVCLGPVDKITKIWIENELVWEGDIDRGVDDSTPITIEGYGDLTFYFGTDTQDFDPALAASGQLHSAYRGQAYIVTDLIFLGEGKTAAPMMEFELGRWPQPSWLVSDSNINGDCNPVAIAWEWWTNTRYGYGLDETIKLNTVQLAATGATLFTEELGVSPFMDREVSMRTAFATLLEHIDGYPTGDGGLLGIDLVRVVADPVPEFTVDDIVGKPRFNRQAWQDTRATTYIDFKDRLNGWPDSGTKYHNRANWQITGVNRTKSFGREWATLYSVAQRMANAIGRVAGVPQQFGTLGVLRSSLGNVKEGSVFTINYAPRNLVIRARAKTVSRPTLKSRYVNITWEEDRAWANVAYAEEVQDPITPEAPLEPVDFYDAAIMEMPYGMVGAFVSSTDRGTSTWGKTDSTLVHWGMQFARGNLVTTGWRLGGSFDPDPATISVASLVFNRFMLRGKLTDAYTDDTLLVDETVRVNFELLSPDDTIDSEFTLTQALSNVCLMFIGDEDEGEILSLFDIEDLGSGQFRASTIRGRYDTIRTAHADDAVVWIAVGGFEIQRLNLYETTYYFKGQPMVQSNALPIEDCTLIEKTPVYRAYRPLPPSNLFANGDTETGIWALGVDVDISWTPQNPERTADDSLFEADYPQYGDQINLQVYRTSDDALVQDLLINYSSLSGDQTEYTLDNADLITWLGSRQDFYVRAYCLITGYASFRYNEVNVIAP